MHPTAWEDRSINLPENTFAFTAYFTSRELGTKDNCLSQAW